MHTEAISIGSARLPSPRSAVVLSLLVAGVVSAVVLDLTPSALLPSEGGRDVAGRFFARALSPALSYESAVPPGTRPILVKAMIAARETVVFAAAAMFLALVVAFPLGFVASTSWWVRESNGSRLGDLLRRAGPFVYAPTRFVIALMRSVHELLWAVLLLAALGLSNFTALIAIAIPYAGTLAKVFSEMIDEAPRDAAAAVRQAGATPLQSFLFALLPRALPDISAYAFYRFECALRSSAILGFFGFPTLGYYIAASFENLHYGEVWTYLYTLFALVVIADWWSGALRRRFVA